MVSSAEHINSRIWKILESVKDPEIPVLNVIDLGIIRGIEFSDEGVEILLTPTYSGCPAIDVISMQIKIELASHGFANVKVTQVLSPAWTTEWMTQEGKEKLAAYGIAPPNVKQQVCEPRLFESEAAVQCPQCQSWNTHRISEFGSTACKSLYKCEACQEPFDYFKCH